MFAYHRYCLSKHNEDSSKLVHAEESVVQTPTSPISGPPMTVTSTHTGASTGIFSVSSRRPEQQVSPFTEREDSQAQLNTSRQDSGQTPTSPVKKLPQTPNASPAGVGRSVSANSASTTATGATGQVYVVHHDGGRAPPVTVIHESGTEVVELPPCYENRRQSTMSGQGSQSTSNATWNSLETAPLSPNRFTHPSEQA
jgi:hypothetical protein